MDSRSDRMEKLGRRVKTGRLLNRCRDSRIVEMSSVEKMETVELTDLGKGQQVWRRIKMCRGWMDGWNDGWNDGWMAARSGLIAKAFSKRLAAF